MGKSPGKWLKTLLFRKKSSRSNSGKPGVNLVTNEKRNLSSGKEPLSESGVNSPLVSQKNPVKNDPKCSDIEAENRTAAEASLEVDSRMSMHQELEKCQTTSGVGISQDLGNLREDQAAIKLQALFRGCLARRAFQALKGIIRLQALVRGHLVRRQAIATLLCLQSIIKLQAAFRGRRVRHSDLGVTLHHKMGGEKTKGIKSFDAVVGRPSVQMEKLLSNAFVKKVLVSSSMMKPLQIYYGTTEPNSVWCWLERWTIVYLIIPSVPQKNALNSHVQKRSSPHATSNEANRSKGNVRTRSSGHNDILANGNGHEPEKAKKNLKKLPLPPVDLGQEPQSELEKVKRNLRKVTANAAMIDTALDRHETGPEKLKHNMRKPPSLPTDIPDDSESDSDNNNKATPVTPTELPEPKKDSLPVSPNRLGEYQQTDSQAEQPIFELNPIQVPTVVTPTEADAKDGNLSAVNGDLSSRSKDDQVCQPAQKSNKRRSSFLENGLNSSPTVPSYMAATESAKAKLPCQGSPRFDSDAVEGDATARRHSLPSVSNAKVSSPSPRTQRVIQSNGKGSIRDRSHVSSRDGTEKAEWRR